jgi:glycosyltransferase involved in cell wall biosynthesis
MQTEMRATLGGSGEIPRIFHDCNCDQQTIPDFSMPTAEYEATTGLHPIELRPLTAKPLVSILVSNYNYAQYIGATIQSALEQTYSNIELIICDDGSTDDSVSVIGEWERKDARLRFIPKANGGQGSGFNAAFTASRGEVIALLDSDDLFLPHKVERIVADFQANPDAGFGVHRVMRMSADLRRQGVWPMSAPLPKGWYGAKLMEDGGILPYMPPTSGLSLRRQVADRIFPLSLESPLVKCPDQLITRLAPLITNVTCEDEALSQYRLHANNNYGPNRVTAASFKRELEYCDALWGAQKRFLRTISPQLAEDFRPVDLHPYIAYNRFLYARLAKSPEVGKHYESFMASLTSSAGSKHVWFWRLSPHLPYPVFDFAVNLLIRQSWLKQLVSRIKRMS